MIVQEMRVSRALMALLVGAVVVCFAGCPNLSQDLDLKAQIQGDVLEANAEQISIQVMPESSAMGVTSPSGTTSAKIGVAFQVTAASYVEYAFVRWEKTAGDGDVSFADATSLETMATITGNGTGVIITARFDARPSIFIADPDGGENILRNRRITITFSEPVDPASVSFDTIGVIARYRYAGPSDPWISMNDKLDLAVSDAVVTLSLKAVELYEPQHSVRVTVLKSVTDLDGHLMAANASWQFITGNDTDTADPILSTFVIKDGTTTLGDGAVTRLRIGLTLTTTATDDSGVTAMRVTETAGVDTVITNWGYDANLAYELRTPGDNAKTIEVVVLDSVMHESGSRLRTINLDTVSPAAPGVPVYAGGTWIPRSVNESGFTLTVGLPVAEADPARNAKAGDTLQLLRNGSLWKSVTLVQADVDAGTRTVSVGARELGADGGGEDGDKLIGARLTDAAGNVGASSSSDLLLKLDTVVPAVVGLGSSDGDGIVKDGDTVTLTATFTQAVVATPTITIVGGGSAVYQSGSGTSWTYSWTVNGADGVESDVAAVIGAQDAAGNLSTDATGPHNFHIDNLAPAVVGLGSSDGDGIVKDGDTVTLTATFTQAVVATPTITIVGGGSAVYQSGSGTSWTYSWTVNGADGVESDVAAVISAQDAAGNLSTDATGPHNFHIDNLAPAAPGVPVYAGGTWIPRSVNESGFTLTVSLPVAEADPARNAKAGDTLQLLRSGSLWKSVTLVQADVDAGTRTVSVGARELGADGGGEDGDKLIGARLTDAAGNVGASSSSDLLLKLDTVVPAVVGLGSSDGDGIVKDGDTVTLTATFTQAVVATPTITIVGGGSAVYQSGSGTSWTYSWTVNGADGVESDVAAVIGAQDAAGNLSTDATGPHNFHIDNLAPAVVGLGSSDGDGIVKDGDTVTLTATFTQAVVATPTITIVGGGSAVYQSGSGTSWTYSWTVNGADGVESDVAAVISAQDAAGNLSTDATGPHNFHIDNVKPVISSVTLSDEPPPSNKNKYASVTFNEDIYGDAAMGTVLDTAALTVVVVSGSAVVDSTSTARTAAREATVTINWKSGFGPVRDDEIRVETNGANVIYDAAGNAMAAGSGAVGTAKRFSIQVPPANGGAVTAKPGSIASISRGIQPLAFLDQAPARQQPAQAASRATPSASPRQQTTTGVEPLAQFHRPIVLPDKPKPEIRDARAPSVPTVAEATDRGTPVQIARGTSAAAPAVRRSEARIALPEPDAVVGLAEPSPEKRGASSIPVVGIFILGAVLLLVCGWFGALLLRRAASRR